MRKDRTSLNLRMLLTLLILANVPLWGIAFFTVDQAQTALEEKIASDFRAIVRKNAVTLNYAVKHLAANVRTIAISPAIREIVRTQNAKYPPSAELIQKRVKQIEKIWLTPEAKPIVDPLLANPASRFLRQYVTANPGFKRITVTDRFGAVAAATLKTVDYDQADESWWRETFKDGFTGHVVIEDVTIDPITNTNSIHIAVPIQDENQDLVIGTIGAVLDIGDLFPLVSIVKIGETGDTILLKEDGTIISATDVTLQQQAKLPYFDDISNALHSSRKPDFIVSRAPGGNRVYVAFADAGLSSDFPQLKWMTVVAQEAREARASLDVMVRNLLWTSLIVLIVIIGLALYLSTYKRMQFTDIKEVELQEE